MVVSVGVLLFSAKLVNVDSYLDAAFQGNHPIGKFGDEKDDKYSCIYNDVYNDDIEYQGNFRSRSNTVNDYEIENEYSTYLRQSNNESEDMPDDVYIYQS
ncbi:hypothetical protein RF11_12879 [Thelohanellus kitauei]|uniref:Uncharacterized protein n=1 Tax=Thelohanellus kitauei TaxID=669202 RepID=A0A0C2MAV0_THEKT|nr:hypothetical protein RF11_12879 [Thelohanellus kitauei]